MLFWLLACTIGLGPPPVASWDLAPVRAVVAEPDVDRAVEGALLEELAAAGALGRGRKLTATVLEAGWTPIGRSGETVLYEARLVVLLEGDGKEQRFSATLTRTDPGSAIAALSAREASFRELAIVIARKSISWLTTPSAATPTPQKCDDPPHETNSSPALPPPTPPE